MKPIFLSYFRLLCPAKLDLTLTISLDRDPRMKNLEAPLSGTRRAHRVLTFHKSLPSKHFFSQKLPQISSYRRAVALPRSLEGGDLPHLFCLYHPHPPFRLRSVLFGAEAAVREDATSELGSPLIGRIHLSVGGYVQEEGLCAEGWRDDGEGGHCIYKCPPPGGSLTLCGFNCEAQRNQEQRLKSSGVLHL